MKEIGKMNAGLWYKKYSYEGEYSPTGFIRMLLDSDLDLTSIRVHEDTDGEMMDYTGAYTKEELQAILDELSAASSYLNEIGVNLMANYSDNLINIAVGLSSDDVLLSSHNEDLDLNTIVDDIKKNKTL